MAAHDGGRPDERSLLDARSRQDHPPDAAHVCRVDGERRPPLPSAQPRMFARMLPPIQS